MAHFGWSETEWEKIGRATMAGHLLECGAQVSGGYFADPGFKDVPDLHAVGLPIAEIEADGSFVITKASATGGEVNAQTVKEQLLYEIHDPAAYLTPDVVADISEAEVIELEANRVAVTGVRGHPRPDTLKAIVLFAGGFLGEGEISYAGPNAAARARLAAEIIRRGSRRFVLRRRGWRGRRRAVARGWCSHRSEHRPTADGRSHRALHLRTRGRRRCSHDDHFAAEFDFLSHPPPARFGKLHHGRIDAQSTRHVHSAAPTGP
jgi:hypothetical protein